MRINKLHLVGLAVAAIGVTANGARAEDLTIGSATTTPVETADPVAGGLVEAGNVTITSNGSITVAAGEAAVTVNSDNDVTNNGVIASNNANDSTGIFVTGGRTATIANDGAINLLEDYTLTDGDSDGDLDGGFADPASTGRHGIWVDSGGFTGNISSASIAIEGNDSAAIRLDGLLTGNLTSTGAVNVTGDGSEAFLIQGGATEGVDGDVSIRGTVNVRGTNASGLVLNAPIINGGELSIHGAWNVTGFHSTTRPSDVSNLDGDDLQNGGSAIAVHYSVAGGITIEGPGVEDDPNDDGDGETDEADDNASATINVMGSSPAILIAADPSANLVLGANGSGFGFQNRGAINALGVYDGFDATVLRIEGVGGATVDANDITNDQIMFARSVEADAYGIYIGADATVSTLFNRHTLTAASVSNTLQSAYGVYIAVDGAVPILDNSGTMRSVLTGDVGNAITILDLSGTLTTINNSGSILAIITPSGNNPVTGQAIAIDVSAAAGPVTLTQTAPTPFTDDDAVDDDAASLPPVLIQGDILLSANADVLDLLEGEIRGDISFGDGADIFNIDNGSMFVGQLSDSDGDLAITVTDGLLDVRGGTSNITSASFAADGRLNVLISDVPAESTLIVASGAVSFASGSTITATVPTGLPAADTVTFLTANGGLFGSANVTGQIIGSGTPYLYNLNVQLANPLIIDGGTAVDGDPNSLILDYQIKTPAQLGMNQNQGIALDPILEALRQDENAAAAFAALSTQSDFFDAYEDLMPSFSSAATELAATAIQQMQSATTNRLAATRLHELNDISIWAQEIAYGLTREPATIQGQEFEGQGFGFAGGIDGPLNNGGLFGLSVSFITSEMEEPGRPEGEISATFGQANAYFGTAMGPFDLDFVAGLGAGKMQSRRFVEIGDSYSASTEADWWSYEGHGAVRISAPMSLGNTFVITPQTALTYVYLNEQSYEEEGGGAAIDYAADSATSQRLWGDVGVEFSARFRRGARSIIAPRLYAGWRANLLDEEAERTFRVISTGDEFTLTDEALGDGGPLVGIGVDASNGYSTFTLGYEGEFGDQIERHSLNAAIRFRF